MRNKITIAFIAVAITILLAIGNLSSVVALAQNTVCYIQQGGANVVAGSGCTYTFQSGSNLTVSSGATVSVPAGVLSGAGVIRAATPILCKLATTTLVTDTVTYTSTVTAVTTPTWANCSLQAITGDANNCAAIAANGSITITIKNSAATPAANATGAAVNWAVCGAQ